MNLANGVLKSKLGKLNVDFSTSDEKLFCTGYYLYTIAIQRKRRYNTNTTKRNV